MEEKPELLIVKDGPVCTITINREEKYNALTPDCLLEMDKVLGDLSSEGDVRVVVIRGAGERAFCAGYDISSLPAKLSGEEAESLKETPPMDRALMAIQKFPYPVIAMINGFTFGGGCELAIGCDIRIAAKRTKMGMPPAKLGLVYPHTGYKRFLRVLGFPCAMEIFLTGRQYDSQSCLSKGLVNYVIEDDQLEVFTYDLARELSENAPLSLKGTKYALYKLSRGTELSKEEEEELSSLFTQSLNSEDVIEGKQAFQEKRKPKFKGR